MDPVIIFLGSVIGLVVQATKTYVTKNIVKEWEDVVILSILAGLSLITGIVAYVINVTGSMLAAGEILVYASATWALFLRRFEK